MVLKIAKLSLPLEIEDMQIVQQQSEDQNVDKVQKKTLL